MNKKKLFITILIVVVAIAIIVAIILNSNKGKENKEESTNQNQTENILEENNTLTDYTNLENVELIGEKKQNNSEKLAEEKEFEGMTVKEIELYALNGITNFSATVENTSQTDFEGGSITIIFLNSDGSEYGRLEGSLPEIKVGGSNAIDASTTTDFSNAYDFKIELVK